MLAKKALLSLVLAAFSLKEATAWWSTGHMLAARIAYDKLNADSPALLTRANTVLSHLAEFTTVEKDYPFVECATFADDIKSKGWDDQADWHFVDNPFFDDGFNKADWYPNAYNITWEMGELISALKNANDAPEPNGGAVSWNLGDSFNLRLLIHYIGDIHQPLHATSRFTAAYPEGDRGGNSFKLTNDDDVNCLHALWDSVLHEYSQDLAQPLSVTDWNFLGTESAKLTKKYPVSTFSDINAKYTQWDSEALAIAESFVYEGIKENTIPSDEYLAAGVLIAEK